MTSLPTRTDVLIVGAGPCGLAAAISLKLKGVEVTIVDQLEAGLNLSRALVVHAKTLELLDTIGCAQTLMQIGNPSKIGTIRDRDTILIQVDFSAIPSPFKCALIVSQHETEEVLAAHLKELGINVIRPKKVVGLTELEGGVAEVKFEGGETVVARYIIGADGAHSTIRQLANVKFVTISQLNDPEAKPIDDESEEYLAQLTLADVHLSAPHNLLPSREFTLFSSPEGGLVWVPFSESVVRIIAPIPFSETPPKVPSVEYLNDIVEKRGIPGGPKIDRVIWGARFRIRSCLAQEFVIPYSTNSENGHGAILLAGDAAHVHSPAGGQGMNLGIRDGILLGDVIASELASSSKGASVSARLIEFGKERQRIAAEVIKMTEWMTWAAVNTGTGWRRLVRNSLVRPLGWFGFVRRRIALQMSGINF